MLSDRMNCWTREIPSEVVRARNSIDNQERNEIPWRSPSTVDSDPARQIEYLTIEMFGERLYRIISRRTPVILNSFSKNSTNGASLYSFKSIFSTALFCGRLRLRPCFNSTSLTSLASSSSAQLSPINWMNLERSRLSFSESSLLLKTSWREQGRVRRRGVSSWRSRAEILF